MLFGAEHVQQDAQQPAYNAYWMQWMWGAFCSLKGLVLPRIRLSLFFPPDKKGGTDKAWSGVSRGPSVGYNMYWTDFTYPNAYDEKRYNSLRSSQYCTHLLSASSCYVRQCSVLLQITAVAWDVAVNKVGPAFSMENLYSSYLTVSMLYSNKICHLKANAPGFKFSLP